MSEEKPKLPALPGEVWLYHVNGEPPFVVNDAEAWAQDDRARDVRVGGKCSEVGRYVLVDEELSRAMTEHVLEMSKIGVDAQKERDRLVEAVVSAARFLLDYEQRIDADGFYHGSAELHDALGALEAHDAREGKEKG